jgi:putative Holliday junction resolvase
MTTAELALERVRRGAAALDVGRARIGLALSRPGVGFAKPDKVLDRRGTRLDLAAVLAWLAPLAVPVVVVGLPPEQDDGDNRSARLCRDFACALAAAWPGEVWLVDEADTTAIAHAELRLLGMRAARRRREVDRHAAARILDRWLAGDPAEHVPRDARGVQR